MLYNLILDLMDQYTFLNVFKYLNCSELVWQCLLLWLVVLLDWNSFY